MQTAATFTNDTSTLAEFEGVKVRHLRIDLHKSEFTSAKGEFAPNRMGACPREPIPLLAIHTEESTGNAIGCPVGISNTTLVAAKFTGSIFQIMKENTER